MQLTFTPIRSDDPLELTREGDALIINGQRLDFAQLAPGASAPLEELDCPLIARDPHRDADGVLHVTVMLPYGPGTSSERAKPGTLTVARDGPIALP